MALYPCATPGCPELSPNTRCPAHTRAQARDRKLRGLTGARGSTRRWRKLRARVIRRDHGQCVDCTATGNLTVHHRDGDARNDTMSNLVTLCKDCHIETERAKAAA